MSGTVIVGILSLIVLVGGAIGVLRGAVRFLVELRLRISVTGTSEVTYDGAGRPIEAFVFYLRTERPDPVVVEAAGLQAPDTHGDYWRINVGGVPKDPVVRGRPFRWVMPFSDIAQFGLDVNGRCYGFARVAQPDTVAWSRRVSAGPQSGPLTRASPRPMTRPAGQVPTSPPWWVRLR
jgi:hypothetical protein